MTLRNAKTPDCKVRYTTEQDYLLFQRLAFGRGVRWSSQSHSIAQHLDYSKPAGVILKSRLLHTCFGNGEQASFSTCPLPEVSMEALIKDWKEELEANAEQSLYAAGRGR